MTHRHKYYLATDGPECEVCKHEAVIAIAECGCGKKLGPTEIERRLNATELLSAEDAYEAHWAIQQPRYDYLSDALLAYSRTLQGSPIEEDDEILEGE